MDAWNAKRKRDFLASVGGVKGVGSKKFRTTSPNPASDKTGTGLGAYGGIFKAGGVGVEGMSGIFPEDLLGQLEKPTMDGINVNVVDKTLAADVISLDFVNTEETLAKQRMRDGLSATHRVDSRVKSLWESHLSTTADTVSQVDGVSFILNQNIVDASILEPLRLSILASNGLKIGIDACQYLSFAIQLHLTNVLESCVIVSKKRRNLTGALMYKTLHNKIVKNGEVPNPQSSLGMLWGPNIREILHTEEVKAKNDILKVVEEGENKLMKQWNAYNNERSQITVLAGQNRKKNVQTEIESPWWVKEVGELFLTIVCVLCIYPRHIVIIW